MDFMANGLLALGASPAMVHAVEELEPAPCHFLPPPKNTNQEIDGVFLSWLSLRSSVSFSVCSCPMNCAVTLWF